MKWQPKLDIVVSRERLPEGCMRSLECAVLIEALNRNLYAVEARLYSLHSVRCARAS